MKPNRSAQKTRRIAFSAILSALCVLVLYVGSFFDSLDLTFAALSTLFIAFAVLEMGHPWDILIYAVSSLLSVLLLPSKFAAVVFTLFLGFYPIAKLFFERLRPLWAWLLKISLFNTCFLIVLAVCRFVLGLGSEETVDVLLFVIGNVAFLAYDFFLSAITTLYTVKFRRRLRIARFFGDPKVDKHDEEEV